MPAAALNLKTRQLADLHPTHRGVAVTESETVRWAESSWSYNKCVCKRVTVEHHRSGVGSTDGALERYHKATDEVIVLFERKRERERC